ncbi:hypothetical protein ACCO45_003488 [Purpureocillium lilacinum]|uniref:Uncharacterized protein n=1 Tax=Purpureocillium lilacinum TaxID=33203 RepID=A0ACC4E011_PURLI
MCTYARTVFECAHQTWGRRLKLCTIGEDFRDGYLPSDCCLRRPHGLQSRRVPSRCDRCRSLDGKVALLRAKLDECRAQFLKRWPSYTACTGAGATREETKEEVLGSLKKIVDSVESSEDEEKDESDSDRPGSDATGRSVASPGSARRSPQFTKYDTCTICGSRLELDELDCQACVQRHHHAAAWLLNRGLMAVPFFSATCHF